MFISYSHQNKTHADKLLETLSSVDPDLKIFIDTAGLNTGTSWQQLLYNALGKAQWSSCEGTGQNKFVWGRGIIEDATYMYLMNITDKNLLALKFEKYSGSKSQQCYMYM